MLVCPSTCHLVLGYFTAPSGRGVFGFTPPSVKSAGPFLLLPRNLEAGYWAQLGAEPVSNQGPSQPLPYSPVPLDQQWGRLLSQPCSPLPSPVGPARPPVRPGAQARRVDAGFGGRLGSRGVVRGGPGICPTPGSEALRAEAGSD